MTFLWYFAGMRVEPWGMNSRFAMHEFGAGIGLVWLLCKCGRPIGESWFRICAVYALGPGNVAIAPRVEQRLQRDVNP